MHLQVDSAVLPWGCIRFKRISACKRVGLGLQSYKQTMGSLDPTVPAGYFNQSSLPDLKSVLNGSEILVPESEGYADSIKRWSDAAEKKAVGLWEKLLRNFTMKDLSLL